MNDETALPRPNVFAAMVIAAAILRSIIAFC